MSQLLTNPKIHGVNDKPSKQIKATGSVAINLTSDSTQGIFNQLEKLAKEELDTNVSSPKKELDIKSITKVKQLQAVLLGMALDKYLQPYATQLNNGQLNSFSHFPRLLARIMGPALTLVDVGKRTAFINSVHPSTRIDKTVEQFTKTVDKIIKKKSGLVSDIYDRVHLDNLIASVLCKTVKANADKSLIKSNFEYLASELNSCPNIVNK